MSGINLARSDGAYMGEEAVYPVSAKNGAYMYRTDLRCLMTKANGTWIQLRDAIAANVTELNTIPTTSISVGFRALQQDIATVYMWNGTFWTPVVGPQPRMRIYRATGTGYLSASTYFVVPYDALDAAQTINPNNDWFTFDQGNRRIIVKRPGLYHLDVDMRTDSAATQYLRMFIQTTVATTTGVNLSTMGPVTSALMSAHATWRLAANDAVAVMLISPGSDVADTRSTTTGYSNHFMVTRISD